jgi:hypothetical protein
VIFKCTVQHCYYHVSVKDQTHYDHVQADHGCPNQCGTTTYGGTITVSLLTDIWEELDKAVAYLRAEPNGSQAEYYKAYASGLSFTLAKFMVPHFRTHEDISREALKRYKMRMDGIAYETPGLAQRKYEIPAEWKLKTVNPDKPERATRSTQMVKQLNDKELMGIRNGKGFFDAGTVATMYQVPVATIEQIWSTI